MNADVHYELFDDGGSCAMWLPILLPVGTNFHHEYGTYVVEHHDKDDKGDTLIICERISTNTHPKFK